MRLQTGAAKIIGLGALGALLAGGAIGAGDTGVVRPAATHASVQAVTLDQHGKETRVVVRGAGGLAYHILRLQNPERLVLDFSGSRLRAPVRHIPSNLDPVRQVRMAQFNPDTARVVIDLRDAAHYSVTRSGESVIVSFEAANTASLHSPDASAKSETASARGNVPEPKVVLPANLTQGSTGMAAPKNPRQQQAVATARAAATEAGAAAATNAAPAPGAASNPAPASRGVAYSGGSAAPIASAAVTPVKYTGDPISVNLKDVDLHDFFRLIHEISGLNVVVDPNVKGSLTIVLTDVPWDQALDIVMHNNDLDKQLDGNVLRIATKATLRREAEEERDLVKAQAEAVDLVTTTRVLSYAKSDDMATTLKKFLSSRGDILSDPRSNTIIIRDIPSTMPAIDNLIRELDRKSRQVEIEARVVQANRTFSREIGTELGFTFGSGNNFFGGTQKVGVSEINKWNFPPAIIAGGASSSTPGAGPIGLETNLGTSSPTSGFQYVYNSPDFALDMIIDAAENRGVGKLISKPKLITQDNQKAVVKDGVKIPVQTVINNTVSVQFIDAVLELDVTPQITADGTIFMDVTVNNDQIDQAIPRVEGIPAIDTQSANTKVTVNDGQTVVIGGVDVSQQRTSIDEVPLFGSLPLIGNLFRHTSVSSQDQELWFFLTPRILPD